MKEPKFLPFHMPAKEAISVLQGIQVVQLEDVYKQSCRRSYLCEATVSFRQVLPVSVYETPMATAYLPSGQIPQAKNA